MNLRNVIDNFKKPVKDNEQRRPSSETGQDQSSAANDPKANSCKKVFVPSVVKGRHDDNLNKTVFQVNNNDTPQSDKYQIPTSKVNYVPVQKHKEEFKTSVDAGSSKKSLPRSNVDSVQVRECSPDLTKNESIQQDLLSNNNHSENSVKLVKPKKKFEPVKNNESENPEQNVIEDGPSAQNDSKPNDQFSHVQIFIEVSQLIVDRFVDFTSHINQDFMFEIKASKVNLHDKLNKQFHFFATDSQNIFIKVAKAHVIGYNFYHVFNEAVRDKQQNQQEDQPSQDALNTPLPSEHSIKFNFSSLKHCLKRIQKACSIQIEDFQWKNGIYNEQIFNIELQESEQNKQDIELILKKRIQLLKDLVKLEQIVKYQLDLIKRNFEPLFNMHKNNIIDIVMYSESIEKIKERVKINFERSHFNLEQMNNIFKDHHLKCINHSIIDSLTQKQTQQLKPQSLFLMGLLEMGNTIDGVTLSNKIFVSTQKELSVSTQTNFSKFSEWKKRKCHGCMEPILDAGRAITCFNIINSSNPCFNVYCQCCIITFIQKYNFHLEEDEQLAENNLDDVKKERESNKLKHKLWLKVNQNVLFVCPCCQGYCYDLEDCKTTTLSNGTITKDFTQFSQCNFNWHLENQPRIFLKKDIYLYKQFGAKRCYFLCKILGLNKEKGYHRIEVLQNSQEVNIKLSKDQLFFAQSAKKGTKLFKIINDQGTELDLKKQIDKQIEDFRSLDTYPLLQKYKNFLENADYQNNGFNIPKFQNILNKLRCQFVVDHRELYRQNDTQLIATLKNCKEISRPSKIKMKQIIETAKSQPMVQEIQPLNQPEQPIVNNNIIKPLEEPQTKPQNLEMIDLSQENQKDQIISENTNQIKKSPNQDYQYYKSPAIHPIQKQNIQNQKKVLQMKLNQNITVTNAGERSNIGQQMTQDKNIQLAVQSGCGIKDQFQLLITKEVFHVEKADINEERPLISPFLWTDKLDSSCQQWPFQDQNYSKAQYDIYESASKNNKNNCAEQNTNINKKTPNKLNESQHSYVSDHVMESKQDKQITKKDDIEQDVISKHSEKEQIDTKQIQSNVVQEEEKQYMEFLLSLQNSEPKKYNLRKDSTHQTEQLKKPGQTRNYNQVEEGFFDDFPPELIRKYKLKVTSKVKQTIYPGQCPVKRQRISTKDSIEIPQELNECKIPDIPIKHNTPTLQSKEKKKSNDSNDETQNKKEESQNPNESESKKMMTTSSCNKSNRFNLKRFLITSQLDAHQSHVHSIAISNPKALVGLFVYLQKNETDKWQRVLLKEYTQPQENQKLDTEKQKRYFKTIYQDRNRTERTINLLSKKFIMDCNYQKAETSEDKSKEDEEANKQSINKLLNYPLFNNRKRVRKLLERPKQFSQDVMSVTFKPEEEAIQTQLTQKSQNDNIQEEFKDNQQDQQMEENITPIVTPQQQIQDQIVNEVPVIKPIVIQPTFTLIKPVQPVIVQEKLSEMQEKVQEKQKTQEKVQERVQEKESTQNNDKSASIKVPIKVPIQQKPAKNPTNVDEPNKQWIKDMKIQMLTKSRDNHKKVLKFYYVPIDGSFTSSSDEDDNEIEEKSDEKVSSTQQKNVQTEEVAKMVNTEVTVIKPEPVIPQMVIPVSETQIIPQQNQQEQMNIMEQPNFQSQNLIQMRQLMNYEQPQYSVGPAIDQKLLLQSLEHENYLVEQQKLKLCGEVQRFEYLRQENDQRLKNNNSQNENWVINNLQLDINQKEQLAKEQIEQLCIMQHLLKQIYRQHTQISENDGQQKNIVQENEQKTIQFQKDQNEQEQKEDINNLQVANAYTPSNYPQQTNLTHYQQQYQNLVKVQNILDKIDNAGDKAAEQEIQSAINEIEQQQQNEQIIQNEIVKYMDIDIYHNPNTTDQAITDNLNTILKASKEQDSDNSSDSSESITDYLINDINDIQELDKTIKQKNQLAIQQIVKKEYNESVLVSSLNTNTDQIQEIIDMFYKKMIIEQGYKKCKCATCIKMLNPMLISYKQDPGAQEKEHLEKLQHVSQNESQQTISQLIEQLFAQQKTKNPIIIQDFVTVEQQILQNIPEIKDPFLNEFIKREVGDQEMENMERYNTEGKLPLISSMIKEDENLNVQNKCGNQIAIFLNNNQEQIENQDPRVDQLELGLLKTMQTLITQLKLLNSMPNAGQSTKFQSFIEKLSIMYNNKKQLQEQPGIIQQCQIGQQQYYDNQQAISESNLNNNFLAIGQQIYSVPYPVEQMQQMYQQQPKVQQPMPQSYHTNYNNCQIFQPQIINQNYVPNMPNMPNMPNQQAMMMALQRDQMQQFQNMRQLFTEQQYQQQMNQMLYNNMQIEKNDSSNDDSSVRVMSKRSSKLQPKSEEPQQESDKKEKSEGVKK